MWNDAEGRLADELATKINGLRIGRSHDLSASTILLEATVIASSHDGFTGSFYPGAAFLRQLLRGLKFDEDRIPSYRVEHKLVQALLLEHFVPGVVPITLGAVRALDGLSEGQAAIMTDDLYRQGYFLKSALGEASGEASNLDRKQTFNKVYEKAKQTFDPKDISSEAFVFQKRYTIASEFRVHSIEDRVVPSLTFYRYIERIPGALLRSKLEAFIQDVLDQLPNALIHDSVFAWDVAMNDSGGLKVIEVNVTGVHLVYKPGFHCSGFFQVPTWSVACLSRLCTFVSMRYDVSLRFTEPQGLPSDLDKISLLVSRYCRHRSIMQAAEEALGLTAMEEEIDLSGLVSGLSSEFNSIVWMVAESAALFPDAPPLKKHNDILLPLEPSPLISFDFPRHEVRDPTPASGNVSPKPNVGFIQGVQSELAPSIHTPHRMEMERLELDVLHARDRPTKEKETEHLQSDDEIEATSPFNGLQDYEPVQQVISARAKAFPNAVALIYESDQITYLQLEDWATDLSLCLTAAGAISNSLVGVFLTRDMRMVVTLLAIFKAGAAYIPIDPTLPLERIRYIVEDSKPLFILTTSELKRFLIEGDVAATILDIDTDLTKANFSSNQRATGVVTPADSLAYVMYTSGSTGQPKGVMVEHRSLSNHFVGMQRAHGLNESDIVLFKTPYTFDVSVWDIFWPLTLGATIVIARSQGHQDPYYLAKMIQDFGVTTIQFVPTMLREFLECEEVLNCTTLVKVFVIGEPLLFKLVRVFQDRLPQTALYNLYGPTESTVAVTSWTCPPNHLSEFVPIGAPMYGVRAHVLDSGCNPVESGQSGEIYISGIQVARGYLNRPVETAQRFLISPLVPNGRLYRTGDIGRISDDGYLEFLGREDSQLKIRGNRIEPAEIEVALMRYAGICEAVVKGCHDTEGALRLVAYLSLERRSDGPISTTDLRIFLKSKLPDVFIPSKFIFVETFPRMLNGKLDRNALVSPYLVSNALGVTWNEAIESDIAVIVSKIIGCHSPDRELSILNLGGDSLSIIRLANSLASKFCLNISIPWLFSDEASIAAIAELISGVHV